MIKFKGFCDDLQNSFIREHTHQWSRRVSVSLARPLQIVPLILNQGHVRIEGFSLYL